MKYVSHPVPPACEKGPDILNIAFIIPPSPAKRQIIRLIDCSHEAKGNYLWQPNDFMIISSLLLPEDGAVLIDGTADRLTEKEFLERVAAVAPDSIFFALSSVCWASDYQFFLQVKKLHPSVALYVIGDIFLEEEYLAFILKKCDGVICNPYLLDLRKMAAKGRQTLSPIPGVRIALADSIHPAGETRTIQNGIPRHELFQKSGYCFPFARYFRHATVTTMWGCPFSCSYCPDSLFKPVIRAVDSVLAELRHLQTMGIKELFFADKTFGYPVRNACSLLQEMAESFDFSWSCYFHPQLYREDLFDLMSAAGCHTVIIGVDSAKPVGLERYQRQVDKKNIDDLIAHANRLGMNVCADFILGLEHESEADIIATIEYALQLPIDFASFNIAAPFPGTSIRKKAREAGQMIFGREGYDSLSQAGDLGLSPVGYERIRQLRNSAVRRFYLRSSSLRRRLKRTVSLEHFFVQIGQTSHLFRKM